jgi:hypothetical protein
VRRTLLIVDLGLAATFLGFFVGAHLANLGHQPGSVSEYEVRQPFLGAGIFISLALLLAMLGGREVAIGRPLGLLFLIAATLLLVLAASPMDTPGTVPSFHGRVHGAIAPLWVPFTVAGLWMASGGRSVRVLALVALILWALGFLPLGGVIFGIGQRALFLVTLVALTFLLAQTGRLHALSERKPHG